MLIDTLSIAYSGNVGSHVVNTPSQDRFINQWTELLTSHGWTQTAALRAQASMTFPLGVPITDGVEIFPREVITCNPFPGFLAIGDQSFTLYDPFKQVPAPFGTCIYVPEGETYADTMANVRDAINTYTPWFATVVQNSLVSFTLNLVAIAAGPEFNFVDILTSGFGSGSDRSWGGGYELTSSASSNSAQYICACTNPNSGGAGINYLAGNIMFTFTLNGTPTSTQILDADQGTLGFMGSLGVGSVNEYTVIANPYGFAVFDEPRDVSTHIFRTISVFAMAPYFPTPESVPSSEIFIPSIAIFIINPNQIGGAPSWNNPFMAGSVMCLDGNPFRTFGFNPSARVVALRSPTLPLMSPQNTMFHYGAYVQFGQEAGNSSPAWVVGKLWDCCIVTDFIDSDATIDGTPFLTLGYSDGTHGYTNCTFMMAGGAPEGDTREGNVNLFGNGVTWVSGQKFTPEMVGTPITIGGTSYIVQSVTDTEHLVLTSALTIDSNVAYTATDPAAAATGGQSLLCFSAPGGTGGASAFSNSGH